MVKGRCKWLVLALFFLLISAFTSADVTTDALALWHLNVSENPQPDVINGLDMTVNNASFATGIISGGYFFDTATISILNGSYNEFNITNSLTVKAWVNQTDRNDHYIIFDDTQTSGGDYGGFTLQVRSTGSVGGLIWGGSSGSCFAISGNASIIEGSWYMITMVFDDTSDTLTTYLNDDAVETIACTFNPVFYVSPITAYIGGGLGAVPAENGVIDEVALWSRALSPEEIKSVYDNESNGVPYPYGISEPPLNTAPIVVASSPANDTQTGNANLPVEFTATDDLNATMSCTLLIDFVSNMTNSSVINDTQTSFVPTWHKGAQHWEVQCTDGTLTGYSGVYDIIFDSNLSVLVGAPLNNTHSNTQDAISYEVYDTNHANNSCTLYLDGVANTTQNTLNDTVTLFTPVWTVGVHTFYVNCTDGIDVAYSGLFNFLYDISSPFISSGSPSIFNITIYTGYSMNLQGNITDDNLWRVNRTIRFPNGTIFYGNFSGDLPVLTTLYSWGDTFDTSLMPNGQYTLFIEGADSHTVNKIEAAKSVIEDKEAKSLTYELTYDTVEVALTGGTAAADFSDVNTEKLDDRYIFDYKFGKIVAKGSTSIFRVTSQYPIIYLENSPYTAHFILAEKYWLDFEEVKANTVEVKKVDDYNYDVIVTFEQALSELAFNSLGGLNEANLTILFEIDNCISLWSCGGYGACQTDDTALCTSAIDLNVCGIAYSGNLSEFAPQACNYCSRDPVLLNETVCSEGSKTACYLDNNFATCCNVTGIGGDCIGDVPQTTDTTCVPESCSIFGYGTNDITGAVIDGVVKLLISLASVAFLVVSIYVGLYVYNRFKMR